MSANLQTRGNLDGEYAEIISRLRRALRRRVRGDWPHRPLSESELEVLRLVKSDPGVKVSEVAMRLGLARNTVSTLVTQLSDQGMLERGADPDDGRVARLFLSPEAKRRIASWRDRRKRALSSALDELDPSERARLAASSPVLRHLIEILESG